MSIKMKKFLSLLLCFLVLTSSIILPDIGRVTALETLPDTEAPTAPTGFVCNDKTDNTVYLSWQASTDNVGVTNYVVTYIIPDGPKVVDNIDRTYCKVGGLSSNTTYSFTVKAKDAAGNLSLESNQISVTTKAIVDTQAPTAPTGLTCDTKTETTVNLSWQASTDNVGVTNYIVSYGTTVIDNVYGTNCKVGGLSPNTTYNFKVKAKDAAGNVSLDSKELTVTTDGPPDTQAPTAPTNLTIVSKTSTSVTLNWGASTDNVGVTGYRVNYGGGLVYEVYGIGCTVTGLQSNTTYTFTVMAFDKAGIYSTASNSLSVTTTSATTDDYGNDFASAAPIAVETEISGKLNFAGDVDFFSFTVPKAGTYILESYSNLDTYGHLYNSSQSQIASDDDNGQGNNFMMKVTLQENTTYYLKVRPYSSGTTGDYRIKVYADYVPLPAAPTGLTATPDLNTIRLSWNTVSGANSYTIRVNDTNEISGIYFTSHTLTGLAKDNVYKIEVRAVNTAGAGSWSTPVTTKTFNTENGSNIIITEPTTGVKITFPSVTKAGETKINKISTLPSDGTIFTMKKLLQYYEISTTASFTGNPSIEFPYSTGDLNENDLKILQYKNGRQINVTNGTPDVINKKITGIVQDSFGIFAVGIPRDTTPPTVPEDLRVTAKTDTTVDLTWNPSVDDTGVKEYIVYKDQLPIGSAESTSFQVTRLEKGKKYTFNIKAKDINNNISVLSKSIEVETIASDKPTDLACTAITINSAELSWVAPQTTEVIEGYEIYVNQTLAGTSNSTSYSLVGLMPNTTYTIVVKAKLPGGTTSQESSPITITTRVDTTAPTAPANIRGYSIHDTSITLMWDYSNDDAQVAGYEIYRNGKKVGTSNWCSYTDTGLSPNTAYTYTIWAYDNSGNKFCSTKSVATIGDDYGNTKDMANPIEIGSENIGNIEIVGDVDYFYLTSTVTAEYLIQINENIPVNAVLYDKDGNTKAHIDTNTGSCTKVILEPNKKYYLKTSSSDSTGIYGIKVQRLIEKEDINNGDFKGIASGYKHTVAIKQDGSVVAWGDNSFGQCNVPSWLTGVVTVAAGYYHTVALKSDGTVVAWGSSGSGACSIPSGLTGVKAIAAAKYYTVALKSDGTVVAWGDKSSGVCNVPSGLIGVVAIAAGADHTVALKQDGTVVAWGDNEYGQCNVPSGLNGVMAIAAGNAHSLALKQDGTIVAWGNNGYGECNVPSGLNGVTAIAAGRFHTVALKQDGTVAAWGANSTGECDIPIDLSDVKAIAAGAENTVVLKSDGTIVTLGDFNSQCDVPSGLTGVIALATGYSHTVALKQDGTVAAWGENYSDQCKVPVGLSGVTAIAAGNYHTVALKQDGTVVAWGNNSSSQCTVPNGLTSVVAVAAGEGHTVALKQDGTVVAWGSNNAGQCNVPAGLSGVTAIAAGRIHTVALKQDGTVVAWGNNTRNECYVPYGLTGVVAISAGESHTVALKKDGSIVAWGNNNVGQCDISWESGVIAVSAGRYNTIALKQDGNLVASGDNVNGFCDMAKQFKGVTLISSGYNYSTILTSNGGIYGLGKYVFYSKELISSIEIQKFISSSITLPKSTGTVITAINSSIYATGGNNYTDGTSTKALYCTGISDTQPAKLADMQYQREQHGSAQLGGKLYVAGGTNGGVLSTVEAYDPASNTWTRIADLNTPRAGLSLIAYNGKLYAMGGVNSDGYVGTIEEYNPSNNTWTILAGSIAEPRANFAAAEANGKIYVFGGQKNDGQYLNTIEVYDTYTGKWSTLSTTLNTARTGCRAVTVGSKICIIGGYNGAFLQSAEVFNTSTQRIEGKVIMEKPRTDFGATVIDGKIYITGGKNAEGLLDTTEVLDGGKI